MRNESGFTLLETLFAMAVFAVAMLGVIALQFSVIQTDEETRRKDMAAQLLTAGTELVACADYSSRTLYPVSGANSVNSESALSDFIQQVEQSPGTVTGCLMSWGEGKVNVFMRYLQGFEDFDGDNAQDANEPAFKKVLLVSSWNAVKTGETRTLHRVVVKPENMLQ